VGLGKTVKAYYLFITTIYQISLHPLHTVLPTGHTYKANLQQSTRRI